MFNARRSGAGWEALNGAVFNLRSNRLRTEGRTSADAAGLPILPGLARYDEVRAAASTTPALHGVAPGAATFTGHALRRQLDRPRPAAHGPAPRLRASYPLARFRGQSRVILRALKRYGMIVADNGTSLYITGASDRRWNDDDMQLKTVPGSAFEVVRTGGFGARAGQPVPAHPRAAPRSPPGRRPASPVPGSCASPRAPRPQRRPGDPRTNSRRVCASGEATVDVEERAGGAGRARGGEVDAQPVGDAAAAAGQPVAEAEAEQHARAGRALAAPAAPQRGQPPREREADRGVAGVGVAAVELEGIAAQVVELAVALAYSA